MLGYNCSAQSSSRVAPYHILHAVEPTIPPAIREKFTNEVDLDDPEAAARAIMQHAAVLRRHMAIAGANLLIVQHRDSLRYARLRGGAMLPRMRRFEVGDYVYYRNTTGRTALEPEARPEILRVVEVRPTGVLQLQGRCRNRITMHVTHCAPCHLPIDDHTIDPRLARPSANLPCQVCKFPDEEEWMLLCDGCGTGWHTYCLKPPLTEVPEGAWYCPRCSVNGASSERLDATNVGSKGAIVVPKYLEELVGAAVMCEPRGRGRRDGRKLGVSSYLGRQGRAHKFQILYEDGQIEELRLPELRARLASTAALGKKAGRSTAVRQGASAEWTLEEVRGVEAALGQGMPGWHS
ncbi:hypothetical protein Vretimale_6366 [Volvox reticuliferus]|nr:hypothetical protein Vretifemale_16038 [Volvox reticuliferus]GIM01581.1 hypothetical protein Vretimale_6366 [Volvox reticuliferus]